MITTDGTPTYRSVNPTTGEIQAEFAGINDSELTDAIERGESAYQSWRSTSVEVRARIVRRVGVLFAERAEELAAIATSEMGKPRIEAKGEAEFCGEIFDFYADRGPALIEGEPLEAANAEAVIQRRPIGLLLGIMPWNYPFYQVARFVAPNLMLGNTMLLKHANSVPLSALAIARLMTDAGVPEGVYQNVFASREQIATIIADPRVQGVSLTGSERAGSAVGETAGKHLKKCVLELGGSDPYIVLDTDDVDVSARKAWRTRLANTGQACNSNKRLIVMDGIYDSFVERLTELAINIAPGDPANWTDGRYAPLSSRAAAEGLRAQVEDAVDKGATLHAGGTLGPEPTAYFAPAVLTGVVPGMRAYDEELFGPVAVVYRVHDDDEAVRLANDSVYGLGGAVFSTQVERAQKVAERLEVGMANVNTPGGEGANIPFGGVKRSGFGRELGVLGMDEFANKRLFYIKN
ncbi:NAD-dependent succinate-semialdehyde dehydrogenase [Agreia sp. VKM Ac-1783]|uniref:NAD-dependent succinate-semialdehyde dehydrogenase n=1 Tax=Agreia sp. VKM Ac-1783 TaxID=1938889 RepID=UPI000A2AE01B|nr:NAD-dependent succinate-semialdehyde dehydrogenase [Agreia sp. VKM Ac-1783]SMQ74222.1 succinate-semialdehyde dehydrogenase / glutarate-semialdehyde dehydrogenase [Agreia sp. VKM Ac-1783]